MIESMAGVFHISEAEPAPDLAAVMRRVRAGDEVVVEEDGGRAIAAESAEGEELTPKG
jgi:antitoxin (DNA-binding transcriptional repressor) of toxin-antitoxin stability system